MDPEQLEQVIDDLYALAPEDFVPERGEQAKAAKAAGDKPAAATLTALRRPTVGAWLVNTLVRHHGDQLEALFELAASLRAAQDELDGDELRRLTTQRGQLVAAMARQARALAHELGRTVSAGVVEEVEQTLRAALADPSAADEVRAGRLTTGLTYSGLGGLGGPGTGEGAVPIGASGAARPVRPPGPRPTLVRSSPPSPAPGGTARPVPPRPLHAVPTDSSDVVALVTRAEREREAERQARERELAAARRSLQQMQDDEARVRRGHQATEAAARVAAGRADQAGRRVQQAEAELAAARQEQQDAEATAAAQQQDLRAATEALARAGESAATAAERVRLLEAELDQP